MPRLTGQEKADRAAAREAERAAAERRWIDAQLATAPPVSEGEARALGQVFGSRDAS